MKGSLKHLVLVFVLLALYSAGLKAQTGATGSNGEGGHTPPNSSPRGSNIPACNNDCKKEEEVSGFESVKGSAISSGKTTTTAVSTMGRALRAQGRTSTAAGGQGGKRNQGGGASADALADQGRLSPFVIATGSETEKRETANGLAFEQTELSLLTGADFRLTADRIIGAVVSYTDGDSELQAGLGQTDTESYLLGAYLSQYLGDIYLDLFVGYGELDIESTRGAPGNRLTGDTQGDFHTADLAIGMTQYLDALSLSPEVRLSHTRGEIDSYSERASGSATPTRFEKQYFESFTAAASLNASYATAMDWGVLIPALNVSFVHEYNGAESMQTSAGGASQVQVTEAPARNFKNIELSVSAQFKRGVSAFFSYAMYANNELFDRESLNAGLRYELP